MAHDLSLCVKNVRKLCVVGNVFVGVVLATLYGFILSRVHQDPNTGAHTVMMLFLFSVPIFALWSILKPQWHVCKMVATAMWRLLLVHSYVVALLDTHAIGTHKHNQLAWAQFANGIVMFGSLLTILLDLLSVSIDQIQARELQMWQNVHSISAATNISSNATPDATA